tara:strand:- start:147 stop:365 length:219 start_codon:yes stop_codon:yes gene_type:complete
MKKDTHKLLQNHTESIISEALMSNGLIHIEYTVAKREGGVFVSFEDVFEMTAEEIKKNNITKDHLARKQINK